MPRALVPHPDGPRPAVAVTAEAVRLGGDGLELRYLLSGDLAGVRLPATGAPARTDGLWRHTCFEAFVRADEHPAYLELNLSPSSQWAAYRFDAYRDGMRLSMAAPTDIRVSDADAGLELSAVVDLAAAGLPPGAPWLVGLSAVVEDRAGAVSYWALAHPPGRPDFHSPDCFALELPAPHRP